MDTRFASVDAPPNKAFAPIRRLGGQTGWYYADWLWRLRRVLDWIVGGNGFRRGRRDPEWIEVGDAIDCWRVEAFEPDRLLRLAAQLKLPGDGWLEFEVSGSASGSVIRQTAIFVPAGWKGYAYWYLSYPFHQLVFAGLLRGIVARSRRPRAAV